MLSGTPALSRPIELFSQLTCIDLKVFNNVHEYGVRYCGAKKVSNLQIIMTFQCAN